MRNEMHRLKELRYSFSILQSLDNPLGNTCTYKYNLEHLFEQNDLKIRFEGISCDCLYLRLML